MSDGSQRQAAHSTGGQPRRLSPRQSSGNSQPIGTDPYMRVDQPQDQFFANASSYLPEADARSLGPRRDISQPSPSDYSQNCSSLSSTDAMMEEIVSTDDVPNPTSPLVFRDTADIDVAEPQVVHRQVVEQQVVSHQAGEPRNVPVDAGLTNRQIQQTPSSAPNDVPTHPSSAEEIVIVERNTSDQQASPPADQGVASSRVDANPIQSEPTRSQTDWQILNEAASRLMRVSSEAELRSAALRQVSRPMDEVTRAEEPVADPQPASISEPSEVVAQPTQGDANITSASPAIEDSNADTFDTLSIAVDDNLPTKVLSDVIPSEPETEEVDPARAAGAQGLDNEQANVVSTLVWFDDVAIESHTPTQVDPSESTNDEKQPAAEQRRFRLDQASQPVVPQSKLAPATYDEETSESADSVDPSDETALPIDESTSDDREIESQADEDIQVPNEQADEQADEQPVRQLVSSDQDSERSAENDSDVETIEEAAIEEAAILSTDAFVASQTSVDPAWEVDRFHWTDISDRLLTQEAQNLDVVFQSLGMPSSKQAQLVYVTGTCRGEGRSTLSVCLARRAVQAGLSTLLVDGDIAHEQLADLAGLDFESGWDTDAALNDVSEGLVRCIDTGLHLMPLGSNSSGRTDIELKSRLAKQLGIVASNYDVVIIDAGTVDGFTGVIQPRYDRKHTALLVQGGDLRHANEIVDAYRDLVNAGIESIAIAETFSRRKAG